MSMSVTQDEPTVYSPSNHGQRDDFQQQSLDISARIFEQAVANFERTFFPVPTNDSPQPNQAPSYNSSFNGLPNANQGVSPNEHTRPHRPQHNSLDYSAFEIAGALGNPQVQPHSELPPNPTPPFAPSQVQPVHPSVSSDMVHGPQHCTQSARQQHGFVSLTERTEPKQTKKSHSSYRGRDIIRSEDNTLVERPLAHGGRPAGRDVEEQGWRSAVTSSQETLPSAGITAHASNGPGRTSPASSFKRRRDDGTSSPTYSTSPATSPLSSASQEGQDSPHPFKKIRRDDVSHSVSSSSASSKSKQSEPKKNKNKKREQQTQQDSIGDNFRLMQDLRRLAKPGEIWVNEPGLAGYAPKKKRGTKAGARAAKSRVDKA